MADDQPADTMRERADGRVTRLWLWVLLDAGRLRLTAILCAGFFVVVLVAGALHDPPLRTVMAAGGDPVETLSQALVTGVVTGVTLVVTLNQVVLSQETGSLGDQRQRMEDALGFRSDAERFFDGVSPPEPSGFMRALVAASRARAATLRETLGDDVDDDLAAFLDETVEDADGVDSRLVDAEFGTFGVVRAILDFDYSWKIHRARRLRDDRADELDGDAMDAFDELVDVLEFFGPAREHVKGLFIESELVALSRRILYLAVPALTVSVVSLLFVDASSYPGSLLGVDTLLWVVAASTTVAVAPFLLLTAYVVRLATVTRRTLAVGPFILRETDRDEDGG